MISMIRVYISLIASGLFIGLAVSEQALQCIACGLSQVDPNNDVFGSYGTGSGKKRYNHTCEEYEQGEAAQFPFLRSCPSGVQSCFYITGKYKDVEINFRGCANAKYPHDFGCDRELQAVNVLDRRGLSTQVDVEVNICFCNTVNCNNQMSEADPIRAQAFTMLLILIIFLATYQ
ncbi:uncharacterized protein LOC111700237 [Eurytemora carolleeae]|uniref:uncharacterized protein LOC111700237 n=1 Tax=Eurytemora carolleeae TaxID=1294199 RepID=UPI000C78B437|nr:uncharacterized protein LOC111700237 [Eurytemora carolleeae]|eukprot:XP_023326872.1 uncharacterized protein LOC111700237 [Eurytemora affinis]